MTCLRIYALISLFLTGSLYSEDALPEKAMTLIDKKVKKYMKDQNIAGLSIGVIRDNKVVLTKGYGFSRIKTNERMSEDTIVTLASNSKPIIAAIILQLANEKKIDLDEDIRKYLPMLPKSEKGIVTTRLLLNHQSGFMHYTNGEKKRLDPKRLPLAETLDPLGAMKMYGASELIFKPGLKYSYSSYGYMLLSALAVKVENKKWDTIINERIAKPLGLTSVTLDSPYTGQKNWSGSYDFDADKNKLLLRRDTMQGWKHGAGGIKMSVKDFARWTQALLKYEILNEKTSKQMWERQVSKEGPTNYGLGMQLFMKDKRGQVLGHGGRNESLTGMIFRPESKTGFVVLCNSPNSKFSTIQFLYYLDAVVHHIDRSKANQK